MIEKYFPDEEVTLKSVIDNGTSITFVCSSPDWEEDQSITLNDLGIARIFGLNPKQFSREQFVEALQKLFPVNFPLYNERDWNFPIPNEWVESARVQVESMVTKRLFSSIDYPYLMDQDPPLFRLCLLRSVLERYSSMPGVNAPADLVNLSKDPRALFKEEIIHIRGIK